METKVTTDMLNQAAEDAVSEQPKAESTTEAATEQPDKSEVVEKAEESKEEPKVEVKQEREENDQQFRSRLGKRVSRMEDNITSFMEEMRQTIHGLKPESPSNPEQGNESFITTESDVMRVLQKYENQRVNASRNYQNTYLDSLAKLGVEEGLNDAEFIRLEELVKETPLSYKDASIDAERNFLKAMRVIEKERLAKPKVNLKGDTPIATGTISGSKVIEKDEKPIKLDKFAQEFVDYHKISKDKVKAIVG